MDDSEIRKQSLVISRHWDNPTIVVTIRDEGISLECSLDDFLLALAEEIKHPLVSFTKGRMLADLQAAKNVVLDKIKQASTFAA